MLEERIVSTRLKIAFVSTLYAPNEKGGAERTVQVLAEALVARGHEAVVVSLAPDGVARQGEHNGVRVYYVPLANLYWKQSETGRSAIIRMVWHAIDAYNPVMGARVRAILRTERPDVVHTGNLQGFSVSVWRAAASLGIPLVQMLHDYYLACPRSTMFKAGENCARPCPGCRVFTLPRRAYSNLPAAVISLSRRLLERVEAGGLFERVAHKLVIHGADDHRPQVRPRTNKPPGSAIVAGYLGRMECTKGIETLLEAAQRLPDRLTMLLGGKGHDDYVQALQQRCVSPNIHFLGFVQPAEFFSRIDVLVVPSVWEEPLGRVIYEGFAHGIPAVVANVGGMPEIVTPGRTGHVFEPGNAGEIADYLRQQIERGWPGARFFDDCAQRARDFSVDRVFDEYLSVWTAAVRPRPQLRSTMAGAGVSE